jgi:beta-phosphoglucomutase-like phosphatase (HAD superfamily)
MGKSPDMPLLIFDCDGVLVDSELLANAALAKLISDLGHPMTTDEAIKVFTGLQLNDVLALAEALLSFPIPNDLGAIAGQQLLEQFRRELKPVKGVREVLSALTYPRCVASSSTRERLQWSLEVTGLAELFGDRVFSAEQVEQGPRSLPLCGSLGRSKTRRLHRHRRFDARYTRRGCGGHGHSRIRGC